MKEEGGLGRGGREGKGHLGTGVPGEALPTTHSFSPPPPRVHLARLAPLGLRALQVCRACPVRGEQLVFLGPRETG